MRVPGKVDLGQAEEISGKVRYRVAFDKPMEIDVTPTAVTAAEDKLDVTLKTLSFDILGAETHDGEAKKASTVNCTFKAEGINVFDNFTKIANGNILASYPVEKSNDSAVPSGSAGSVQDDTNAGQGSSSVEKAGVVVVAIAAIAGLIAAVLPFLAKIFPELKKIPGVRF